MIAYWRADSDATDLIGNHDGTLVGGSTFADGHCEEAFSLDGVDDCVSVPSSPDFNLSPWGAKSIILWWKADALNTPLITRRDSNDFGRGLLLAIEPADYYLHFQLDCWAKFSAPNTTGQWYQVVLTKDGTDWKMYHNGGEIPRSSTGDWPYTSDATKDLPLLIGQDGAMSLSNFDGLIDEVAVYNKTLSPEEVLALYQSSCHYCELVPTPTPTPSPEGFKTPTPPEPPRCPPAMSAYWRADSDATDHTGNHDGTLMGGATFAEGRCEGAFSLDGVDDYVSVPRSPDFSLGPANDRSIVLWWKADALNTTLMSRRDASHSNLGLLLYIEPSNYQVHLQDYHWAKYYVSYTTSQWYQVAITKADTDWKLYHNGTEIPMSSGMGWPFTVDATTGLPLLIGRDGTGILANFAGLIDEVAVFSKALSPTEVQALYESSCHYCSTITPTPTPEGYQTPTPTPSPTPWGCFIVTGEVRNAYTDQPIGEAYIRTVTSDHSSDPSFNSATGTFSISACSGISSGDVRVEARCLSYLPGYAAGVYTDWQDVSGLIVHLTPESSDPQIGSGDYNGDGSSELAIFRPATGQWAIQDLTRCYYGGSHSQVAPADYDGDGTTDIAAFIPWYHFWLDPTDPYWGIRGLTRFYFGNFTDIPVPGDWDGDGCADAAVFQGGKNLWAVRNVTRFFFGQQGDQPLNADFCGDGQRTAAVFRAGQGLWAIRDLTRIYMGSSSDLVNAMDPTGDGTDSPVAFRASSGLWAVFNSTRFYFGSSGDRPVPGDYLGSGQDTPAIFRESSGLWAVRDLTRVYFGSSGAIPVTR
jgi:hypothetical protein